MKRLLILSALVACDSSSDPAVDGAVLPVDAAPVDAGPSDAAPADAGLSIIVRKVALVVVDPVKPGTRETLSQTYGWWGYDMLATHSQDIVAAMNAATDGHVLFTIVSTQQVDEFPVKLDGFRYDWDSYAACHADAANCHQPDDVAYAPLMEAFCPAIAAGELDEIWVWGFDYSGYDEFAFKIPGDAVAFQPDPPNPWIYDLRKKDLPECGRTYFVMGWNALVPGGNALHSFGHRVESALASSAPSRGKWGACDGSSEWTDFSCTGKDGLPAGCGNVHFPPNAASDYDYTNATGVESTCEDWLAYPALTGATTTVDATTWAMPELHDPQAAYMLWWFAHLPRAPGSHVADGVNVNNDWWTYILCYGESC